MLKLQQWLLPLGRCLRPLFYYHDWVFLVLFALGLPRVPPGVLHHSFGLRPLQFLNTGLPQLQQ
jgi:hypothetical protein